MKVIVLIIKSCYWLSHKQSDHLGNSPAFWDLTCSWRGPGDLTNNIFQEIQNLPLLNIDMPYNINMPIPHPPSSISSVNTIAPSPVPLAPGIDPSFLCHWVDYHFPSYPHALNILVKCFGILPNPICQGHYTTSSISMLGLLVWTNHLAITCTVLINNILDPDLGRPGGTNDGTCHLWFW